MKCKVCSCTHSESCDPPCFWEQPGLCTNCASAIAALAEWKEAAVKPSMAALMRQFKYYWESPFIAASRAARTGRR